jgi:hypothetical protein
MNTIVSTYSPDIVSLKSTAQYILELDRFPISQDLINEMVQYMSLVNKILADWGAYGLSEDRVRELQEYLRAIQSGVVSSQDRKWKLIQTLNNFETRDRDAALWLHFYLELREPSSDNSTFLDLVNSWESGRVCERTREGFIDSLRAQGAFDPKK